MLHLQVNSLFHLVKYTPAGREAYCDAWNLRHLYTFAFRRQKDSDQRGQRPRDWLGEGCGWTCRDFLICCLICCLILCFVAVLWHNCLGICTFMKIRFAFSLHAIYIYISYINASQCKVGKQFWPLHECTAVNNYPHHAGPKSPGTLCHYQGHPFGMDGATSSGHQTHGWFPFEGHVFAQAWRWLLWDQFLPRQEVYFLPFLYPFHACTPWQCWWVGHRPCWDDWGSA